MKKSFNIVSFVQLVCLLLSLWKRGATPAWIETDTREKLKPGNPFGKDIRKLTFANIMLGVNYENAVKKATGDETFQAGKLPWGKWISFQKKLSPVITHKGKFYLRCSFVNKQNPVRTVYLSQDGKIIPKDLVKPWKLERSGEVVTVRNYTVNNIRRCNVAGQRLVVAS